MLYNTIQYNTIQYTFYEYNVLLKLKHWEVVAGEDGVNIFQVIDAIYDRITLDP